MSELILTEQAQILTSENLINYNLQEELEIAEAESEWILMDIYYHSDKLY